MGPCLLHLIPETLSPNPQIPETGFETLGNDIPLWALLLTIAEYTGKLCFFFPPPKP